VRALVRWINGSEKQFPHPEKKERDSG
jgi:hypothetical protein